MKNIGLCQLIFREYKNVQLVTCRDRTGDFVVVMHLLSSIWKNSIGLKNRKTKKLSISDRTKAPSGKRFTTKLGTKATAFQNTVARFSRHISNIVLKVHQEAINQSPVLEF